MVPCFHLKINYKLLFYDLKNDGGKKLKITSISQYKSTEEKWYLVYKCAVFIIYRQRCPFYSYFIKIYKHYIHYHQASFPTFHAARKKKFKLTFFKKIALVERGNENVSNLFCVVEIFSFAALLYFCLNFDEVQVSLSCQKT